jgi:hypothetical protein
VSLTRKVPRAFAATLVICVVAWALIGQRINVVAQSPLKLYDRPIAGVVINTLNSGAVLPVDGCEDVKHYIVPVVMVDGRRAYVLEGDYGLDRKPAWELDAAPVSLSCP